MVSDVQHSVANMFIIPMGMACGADISVSQFLLNNLLPVTLGNMVAGAAQHIPGFITCSHCMPSSTVLEGITWTGLA